MQPGLDKPMGNNFKTDSYSIMEKIRFFLKNNYLLFFLFCAFLFLFWFFYPGVVAYDSFNVYENAYYNHVGNWHSALLTRLWQFILHFTDIRGIFLLIQLVPICLGLYIIARNISKGVLTGIICVLILFIPPVFADIFVVLKDTYLAAFTFLIAALMLDKAISDKQKTRLFCIMSAIVLVLCFYVRANGCFITVPLLVALFMGWKAPIIYRYITCLVVVLCVIATTSFVDLKMLKAKDEAPDFGLLIFDIIGTARNSGQSTLPELPEVPDQMAIIKHCYTPLQWDTISYWAAKDHCNAISSHYFSAKPPVDKSVKQFRRELRKAWLTAIVEHPVAYFKHRISHFNRFLNYQGHRPVYRPIYTSVLGFVDFGSKTGPLTTNSGKEAAKIWDRFLRTNLQNQLWFCPYISLLILLFFYLSTLATSDRFNWTLNVVAFSGMIYMVGFLFVGVSADFRYSYPSLLLSILCILAAFGYYSQKHEVFGTKKTRIIAASVTVPLLLIGIIL